MINNVLIIGLGSIGRRHLDNLIAIGAKDISAVTSKDIGVEFPNVKTFKTLNGALEYKSPDWVWICTPTAFHEDSLFKLLEKNTPNIYLEKPVTHSSDNLDTLEELSKKSKSRVGVGYDLRFDPGINKVSEIIGKGKIGEVINVNAFVGQYLPDWRPYEDYRKGMSAKHSTGGGVLLDLIHEFDYLYFLFGKSKSIACNYIKSGALEIETEDSADVLLKFESGITGVIHLDYLQRKLIRYCIITGSNGTIKLNLALKEVTWTDAETKNHFFSYASQDRNDRFINAITAFIKNDTKFCTLEEGLQSLKQVLAAKKSSDKNSIIQL